MKKRAEVKIFLAHANEDSERVKELHRKLKAAGYSPWLDKIDLIPGQQWKTEIPKALKQSDIFIACLSKTSVQKRGDRRKASSGKGSRKRRNKPRNLEEEVIPI